MISCIYLIDLNSIKSKYVFVCTTFLLNAISLRFWFDFKSISVAILFLFDSNIIFKWIDLEFHKYRNILMALARLDGVLDAYTMIFFTEKRKVLSW